MKAFSQLFAGLLSAIGSAVLVLAAASLALVEGGALPTIVPAATQPQPLMTGTSQAPGPVTQTILAPTAPIFTATPRCPVPPGWHDYTVQQGDTIAALVEQSKISQADFLKGNCLPSASVQLEPGWIISMPPSAPPTATMEPTATAVTPLPTYPMPPTATVCAPPPGWVIYVVRYGDTLYKISLAVGINWVQLMQANCLSTTQIYTGQYLYVPHLPPPPPAPTSTPYPTATPFPSDTPVPTKTTPATVTLSINQSTGGTISASPSGPYHYGDVVTLTASPSAGYNFTGWTGDAAGTASPITITMDGNKTVGATFALTTATLTITQAAGGTITANPGGPYHFGDSVVLTATADTGYTFSGWTGDCSGPGTTCNLTMDGNKTVGASFTANPVTLTITQAAGGTITASPGGPYHIGDNVVLTATADTGYTFSGWTGDCSGAGTTCNLTMDGNKTVGGNFTAILFSLTITQAAGGTITANPGSPYHFGDSVALTATADTGYTFSGWTGDCSGAGTTCNLTMDGNKTVGASFTANSASKINGWDMDVTLILYHTRSC